MSTEPKHGTATITYLERDAFVGTRTTYCGGYRGGDGVPRSAYWPHTVYFCPFCGDIWARAIWDKHFDYDPIPPDVWVIEKRPCVEHGDGQLLFAQEDLELCSPELLKRELLALMENAR